MFQNKKGFITCSRLKINELGRCPTKSNNACFADIEKASSAIFTAVFCFTFVKYNFIKLKLYNI